MVFQKIIEFLERLINHIACCRRVSKMRPEMPSGVGYRHTCPWRPQLESDPHKGPQCPRKTVFFLFTDTNLFDIN